MGQPAPLTLALLGCGAIARTHAATLRGFAGVRVGFASRDAARARDYARRFGQGPAYGSYEDALNDPGVSAVVITTPPAGHASLARAALAAGKHVLVEKPAFLSVAELDAVAGEAATAGRRVLVLENYAYRPLTRVLARLVADDEIGAIRFVRINALKRQAPVGWRADPAQAGGGALFEGGVHWVSLLTGLGPRVLDVQGFAPPRNGDLERAILVVATLEGGGIATLHHAWDAPVRWKGLSLSHVIGVDGTITFESNGLFGGLNGRRRRRIFFPGLRDIRGFRAMFSDFLATLRTGREPVMSLARARGDLAIVEAAYRTAGLASPSGTSA
jgi:predicted dehydrogenase